MGTIRFTAAERPGLLADAIIANSSKGEAGERSAGRVALLDLAYATKSSDGRRFDAVLTEHFRDVALARLGVTPDPTVGGDPETGGEADVE